MVKKPPSPPLFFSILLLLCLPGTARLRSTAPPLPEGDSFSCSQQLPGYTVDQTGRWLKPVEQMLLSLPGTDTVESRIETGKVTVSARHRPGKTSGEFTAALDRITESCSGSLPEGTLPARFTGDSIDSLPLFIFLSGSREEARRAEELFGKIPGAGNVRSSAAKSSRTALVQAPSSENPFPAITLVASVRQGNKIGLREQVNSSAEKGDTVHLDGLPVTILTIGKGRSDIIALHGNVMRTARRLEEEGITLLTLYDAGRLRINEIRGTIVSILTGFLLVGMILHIRHRSLPVTLALLGILPAGMLPSLALTGYLGIPLNLLTLSAFACCTGTVVDAAVLILEELQGRWTGGRDAALTGTVTTIAAFLPLPFLPSALSFLIADYALIVTVSLSCSLFYSLVILPPMLPDQIPPAPVPSVPSFHSAAERKTMTLPLLASVLILLIIPCLALIFSGRLSFSYYGKRTPERLDFGVEYPPEFPASSMQNKLREIESAIMPLPGAGPVLASYEGKRLNVTIFPDKKEGTWDPAALTALIGLHIPAEPGVLIFPAESDMESSFSIYISGGEREKREELSRNAAGRLRNMLPESRIYFSETAPRRSIEVLIDLQKAGIRGVSPSILANELAWRLGGGVIERESGGGAHIIEAAGLNTLDKVLSAYPEMLRHRYSLRRMTGYRRNGLESSRIICAPESSRKDAYNAVKMVRAWGEEAGNAADMIIETAPDRRRVEQLAVQAGAGAAASLLAVFLLLLVRYGQTGIPLMLLFPMFTSIAWPLAILAAWDIPLTIPGTGALFFAAGLSVNTGVLLLPPGGPQRSSRPLPLASLVLPALSTWAGTAPLLIASSAALRDVPVILAAASLFGTLSAFILFRLRSRN